MKNRAVYVICILLLRSTESLSQLLSTINMITSVSNGLPDFILEVMRGLIPVKIEEDAVLSTPELLEKYGYPCEIHNVITEDGYILTLHRIPSNKGKRSKSVPILLQHGFSASSADWVIPGPRRGIAYVLSDNGYDVWLGNTRDTVYCRKHTYMDPYRDAQQFWNFTFDELGYYDVPAIINYIQKQTDQDKIFYVGHSQATAVAYIMCSQRPEYNRKISAIFSLAPIAFQKHMYCPQMILLSKVYKILQIFSFFLQIYQIPPVNSVTAQLAQVFCNPESLFQPICTGFYYRTYGYNPSQLNERVLPIMLGHDPAGICLKNFFHFLQLINSGQFHKYDYGYLGNLRRYGTLRPPNYNLFNVKAPVFLFYSNNDYFSNATDPELIRKYGYTCEVYSAVTNDGYIVEMHRIPYGKNKTLRNNVTLFLQHGFAASSADWVMQGPSHGLGFYLADRGYDVWLGNSRSTRYGRKHVTLNPKTQAKQFYNYSFSEIGLFDLPAMIDCALNETGKKELYYIGHSEGTTEGYILTSEIPKYNNILKGLISLAPIAFVKETKDIYVSILSKVQHLFKFILKLLHVYQVPPTNKFTAEIAQIICGDQSPVQIGCLILLSSVVGFDFPQANLSLLPIIFGQDPPGVAVKELLHFLQLIRSNRFCYYDYGGKGNKLEYGSKSPPDYKLWNIKGPLHLFYSDNDYFSGVSDVLRLHGIVQNSSLYFFKGFNHLDYQYAIDAPQLVYTKIENILKQSENS